ncbi:hypothetical protein [Bradyrhizobium sp. MOS002]|uniref:hypothetical protein n=1 Tax=Bradyrhizobium sp. MOS002 TaxID=2133947 RepID=UPI000D431845|nr:hypothetical protein [Bradyrhizobium sp. MOS002]PSO19780.1 hypothetical protein C7G41_35295 [Bradyrhizobium sp. MOS002]
MIPQAIRDGLLEIAQETGRSYAAVEKVFELCVDASDSGVTFHFLDGELTAIADEGDAVPQELLDAANAIYDDMVAVSDTILLLTLRLAGRSLQ